jgi:hypothetical protein
MCHGSGSTPGAAGLVQVHLAEVAVGWRQRPGQLGTAALGSVGTTAAAERVDLQAVRNRSLNAEQFSTSQRADGRRGYRLDRRDCRLVYFLAECNVHARQIGSRNCKSNSTIQHS